MRTGHIRWPIVFLFAVGLLAFATVNQAQAQSEAPTVTAVAIASDPGTDGGYAIGDSIEVALTFSQAVTVTGTPRVTLDVGNQDRPASYSEGSSSARLVFSYTVAAGDEDTDGIAVKANSLALNGGTIRAGATDAALPHAALQANDQKVDGIAPTVTVGGETRTYVPPARQFAVTFYFNEKVYGLADADITVTNGTAHDVRAPTPFGRATWARYTRWDAVVQPASEGPVTVTLQAGAATDAYGNASSAPATALSVIAADPVAVAVSRTTSGFAEGGTAEFTVTRSRDNGEIPVSLSLDQTGDFLSGTVEIYPPPDPTDPNAPVTPEELTVTETPFALNVTFAAGETSKRISVPTEDDRWVEDDGAATLSVPTKSDQYKYIPGFADSATSEVRDNDVLPIVSAYWRPPHQPYTTDELETAREGGDLVIAYLRSADNGPLAVFLSVTDPGDLLELDSPQSYGYTVENDGALRLDFPAGSRYQNVVIPIRDDDTVGAGGSVTIAVLADDEGQYEASSTRGSITVPVADDDSPLTVTLDVPAEVVEGDQVVYTLNRAWEVSGRLDEVTVNLRLEQTGDYVTWPQGIAPDGDGLVVIPVTFTNRALTATIALDTEDDEVSEVNGRLSAQLVAPSDNSYAVGVNSPQTTVLRDNEAPVISIEAVAAEITEGANAQYRITRQGDTTTATNVGLYVTGMPKIMTEATKAIVLTSERENPSERLTIHGAPVDYILEFAAGETEKTFSLTTEADSVNEGGGWLAVSILRRTGVPYAIETGRAQVHVNDDDIPTVSLDRPVGPTGLSLSADGTTWEGQIPEGAAFTYGTICTATGVTGFSDVSGTSMVHLTLGILYANHPALYGAENQHRLGNNLSSFYHAGANCQNSPWTYPTRGLYVGPENGVLEIELVSPSDLVPIDGSQRNYQTGLLAQHRRQYAEAATSADAAGTLITTKNIFYHTSIARYPLNISCSEGEPRYCPTYNVGTVNKIRLTVINRDPTILIKAESASVTEGQPARFILERLWATDLLGLAPPLSETVVFLQASQDGHFITGSLPTQVTFGQNETRKIVELPSVDDDAYSADGSVTIELLPDTSTGSVNQQGKYTVAQNWLGHTPAGGRSDRATVVITNNDEKPGITIAPSRADEGDSGSVSMTFTVSLGSTVDSAVQVNWATSDGTATAGQDYTTASDTVTIPANSLSADFAVSVTGDTLDEPDETFNVTISLPEPEPGLNGQVSSGPPVGIVGGDTATTSGTITDDDPVVVTVVPKEATVAEGEDAVFVLTRTGYTAPALTMSVRLSAPGRVSTLSAAFDAGAATTEVSVQTVDDALVGHPPRRKYTLEVMGDGDLLERDDEIYTPGTPNEATVTAEDDDEFQVMTVHAIDPFPKEGEGIVFEFRRTGDTSQPLRFWYNRAFRSHGSSDDEWPRLRAEFAADQTILRKSWNPFPDDEVENGSYPWVYTIRIYGDGHYWGVHRVWVAGDPNIASFVVYDDEGSRNLLLRADFPNSGQIGETIDIDFTVLNNNSESTGENIVVSSTWESDGRAEPRVGCTISGPLATGESGTCRASFVLTQADSSVERIDVDAIASDGAVTSNVLDIDIRALGGVTVRFRETTRLSVTEPAYGEANAQAVLAITRAGKLDREIQVGYTIEPTFTLNRAYPPIEGVDYADNSTTPGVITFAANETLKNITIDILGDEIDEPTELFKVTLIPPAGVLVEDEYRDRTVAIVNRDPPTGISYLPTASLEIVSADPTPESAGSVDFAVVLTREWGQNARFEVELDAHNNLTATPSDLRSGRKGDFDPPNGIIYATIPAGQTRFEFSIVLNDDDVREEDETFQMQLGTSIGKSFQLIGDDYIALATIADDDFILPERVDLSLTHSGSVFQSISESTSRRDLTVTASFPDIRWPTDASDAPLRPADPRDVDTTVRVAFDDAGSTADLADIQLFQVQDSQGRFRDVEHFDIVIPAGQISATATLRFRPENDAVDEDKETVVLRGSEIVSTVSDASLPVNSLSFNIRDDDTRGITIAPALVDGRALMYIDENSTATYSLVLDSQPTEQVTIVPARDDSTPGNSTFITVAPAALIFTPSNWNEPQEIVVTALEDGDTSKPRSLALVTHGVSTSGDYAGETVNDIFVFISDTTQGTVYLDGARASESDEYIEFTVTVRPVLTSETVSLEYFTNDGSAERGIDYTGVLTGTPLSIDPGAGSATIRIPIIDNDVHGPAEKVFSVLLRFPTDGSNASRAELEGGAPAIWEQGIIVDDDPEPVVSVSGPDGRVSYVSEGATGPLTFTLTLLGKSTEAVTVDYATGETGLLSGFAARQGISRATSGEDYAEARGTVTFSPGETTEEVRVQLTDDDVSEDIEYFGFKISNAQNGQLRNGADEEVADVGVVDDDLRGLTIDPISIALDEPASGETAVASSYTVKLKTKPTDVVTVTIGGTNPAIALSGTDLNNNQLTFTTENWDTAQTVTVTPVKDANAINETVTLTHTPSGGDYSVISADSVTVTLTDSDTKGIVISRASLAVTEGDTTGTNYTVNLATQPASDVTVTISGHGTALNLSGTGLSGDALTFTTTNWSTAQTVTVKAAHDDNAVDEDFDLTHTATGADYAGVAARLSVMVTDDDPTVTVMFGQASYTVNEGETVDVTVTLSADPERTVVIPITSTDQNNATATDYSVPTSVTFNSGDTSQTITFAASLDDVDDDNESVVLGFGTMPEEGVTAGSLNQATVNITDDDTSGIVFDPVSVTVTEEDASGTDYTVKLATKPSSDVTVTITGHGGTALTLAGTGLSGDALTFTTTNWSTAQTLTVTAAHDDNGADEDVNLTHEASGGGYASVSADLPVTVTDDDPAVTAQFGQASYTVAEGDTVDVMVTLSADPERTVVIPITTTNQGGASSNDYSSLPTNVTFNSGETSQTITFAASSDDVDDDNESVALGFGTMPEEGVTSGSPNRATVTITDDDTSGIVLSPTGITVTEEAVSGTSYTVKLRSEPTGDVTVTITGHSGNPLSLSRDRLTFTASNWNTTQSVTVTAAHDDNGVNELHSLTHGAAGGGYDNVSANLGVTVNDDDPAVTVMFGQSSYTVNEGGTVDVTVTLSANPERRVVIPITATNHGGVSPNDYSGVPASVTFTSGDTSETITLSATQDTFDDDGERVVLGFGTMPEEGVTEGSTNQATVNITDDDTSGIVLSPTSITVTEEAVSGTSYTVKLRSEPTGDVTVTITGHSGNPLSLSDDSLTFTSSNWSTAQSVTVTAGHDDNGVNEPRSLTHEAAGGGYDNVSANLGVTVNDDDPAVTVMFGQSSYTVGEGGTVDVTVSLSANPERRVVIPITSTNQGGASSNDYSTLPTSVTFNSGETSQTITFSATQDTVDDDAESVVLGFGTMPEEGVTEGSTNRATVAITDDDTSGIVLSPTSITVTEEAVSGTSYTVKLRSQPTGDVTVTITGHSGNPLSLSDDSLTFTSSNWSSAQSVTVTAAHDDNGVNELRTLTHTASGGGYVNVVSYLSVTASDDDPVVTAQFGQASYTVNEGGTVDVAVTLSADPRRRVVIPITATNHGGASSNDYSGVPASVTFTSGDTSETITLSATQDTFDDDNESVVLGFGTMPEEGVTEGSTNRATVNITDDDTSGIVLSPTSITVTEEAVSGTNYTVKLRSQPTSNVTVTVTGHDSAALTLTGLNNNALTFTTSNWNTAQTVTVTAAHDDNAVDEDVTLTHRAAGGGYDNVSANLDVMVNDDDPAVTVQFGQANYSVAEGGTVDVAVTLSADPERTVVIPIEVSNQGGAGTADYSSLPTSVTFNSGDTSKNITFAASSDDVDDDGESVVLGFGTMPEEGVTEGSTNRATVNITDDDESGVVLSPTSITVTEEAVSGTSYTVKLRSQPTGDVTVTITGHSGNPLSLSRDRLTFTASNWNTTQSVTVTAAHDDNGVNELRTLTHTASGGGYVNVVGYLSVTASEDDPEVTVMFGQSSYTVGEGGTVDVTVTLSADPRRRVVIPITATNHGGASANDYSGVPASVTFTSGDTSETITFAATQDTFDDDGERVVLGFGTMPEEGVTSGTPNQATVNITDDDDSGIVFNPTGVSVTEEDPAGTSYTVKLDSQPSANVTVTVSGHSGTALILSGLNNNALTFTSTNWDTAQSVAVTAAHDDNAENEEVTLTHTASGGGYNNVSNDLNVTINDNDPAVTVMFGQASYTVAEGATVDVTVTLSADPDRTVVIPITSTNQGGAGTADYSGVPASVTFSSGDTSETITFSASSDDVDDVGESVVLGFGTMPEAGVTEGTTNEATVAITDVPRASTQSTPDCVSEIFCSDYTFTVPNPNEKLWQMLTSSGFGRFESNGITYRVGAISVYPYGHNIPPDGLPNPPYSIPERTKLSLRMYNMNAPGSSPERFRMPNDDWKDWAVHISTNHQGGTLTARLPLSEGRYDGRGKWDWHSSAIEALRLAWTEDQVYKVKLVEDPRSSRTPQVLNRPIYLQVQRKDYREISIWWKMPESLVDRAPPDTFYKVQWKEATGSWTIPGDVSQAIDHPAPATNEVMVHDIDGLAPGTEYHIRVIATNPVGDSEPSEVVTAITTPNTAAEGVPRIKGAPMVGHTLSMSMKDITDADGYFWADMNCQWLADDVEIEGAVGMTYTLTAEDEGKSITVRVDFIDYGGNRETVTSAPTAAVAPADTANSQATENTQAVGVPIIAGVPEVGLTLSVDTTSITDADGLDDVVFNYRWLADDVEIEGASGATYTPAPGDEGKTIKVKVDFTDDAGHDESLTSAPTASVSAAIELVLQSATVDGSNLTLTYDKTLAAVIMSASDFTVNVNGAPRPINVVAVVQSNVILSLSQAVVSGDEVTVDYTKPSGPDVIKDTEGRQAASFSGQAVTNHTAEVENSPAAGVPRIDGVPKVGLTLSAVTTDITDANGLNRVVFNYQWMADDVEIEGAEGATYRLAAGDVGKAVKVRVDFTDDAGHDESRTSAEIIVNTAANGLPTISGSAEVGETLTADTTGIADADGLTNVSYSYQWVRVDSGAESDIAGAVGPTHTLESADRGKTIKVRVSFTDDRGNLETLTSTATATVTGDPEVVWSVTMKVKHYGYGDVGASDSELFTNETGGLKVAWLWYSARNRELHLSFMNPVPNAAESTLRLDDKSLAFQVGSSSTAFTFTGVDISWTEDQVVAVSIVR